MLSDFFKQFGDFSPGPLAAIAAIAVFIAFEVWVRLEGKNKKKRREK